MRTKFIQTEIRNDEPDLERCSGNGGRSWVSIENEYLDEWPIKQEAVKDGKLYYKEGVHWCVLEVHPYPFSYKVVYDSKKGD